MVRFTEVNITGGPAVYTVSDVVYTTPVTVSTWVHMATTFDYVGPGTTIKLFKNGVEVYSEANT